MLSHRADNNFWAVQAAPIKAEYGAQRTPYEVEAGSLGADQQLS